MEVLYEKYGRSMPEGTVIFDEGEPGYEMFIIQEGKVKITKKVRVFETTLAELSRGDFFGEMAILEREPRSARAVAMTDIKVLVLDVKTFETIIKSDPDVAIKMMREMAERIRNADLRIETLLFKDSTSKVVDTISKIAASDGVKTKDGIAITIPVHDLAGMVGLEVERTKETIENLAERRFIKQEGDTLTLLKPGSLKKILDYIELKQQMGDII